MLQKKFIRDLALASYKNNQLDRETVEKIASHLTRQELRMYVKTLKHEELKRTVVIDSAFPLSLDEKRLLSQQFSPKTVEFHTNEELLLGIKIRDYDTIYSMNLGDSLITIGKYLEDYD